MKLLLCGGGTAGHINPAIAVAEELLRRQGSSDVLFVGREGGGENNAIITSGFDLKTLRIQGLKRSLSPENIKRILRAFEARGEAEKIIREFKPDVILGTGGYVCWPVLSAGRRLSVPTAIHESNVTPGLTARLLSTGCDRVFIAREETAAHLPKKAKAMVVGNPLRRAFGSLSRREARRILGIQDSEIFIVSFGGSIGAQRLNDTLIQVMREHSSSLPGVKHLHACGIRYYDAIESPFKAEGSNGCRIVAYIDNMPTALSAADIVVCRCGALTLSELCQVGVAAILIPSPNVSANHQYKNAKYLADKNAAVLIEEKNLTAERLKSALIELEIDKIGRKNKAKNIHALATPNAAKSIVDELILMKNPSKGTEK